MADDSLYEGLAAIKKSLFGKIEREVAKINDQQQSTREQTAKLAEKVSEVATVVVGLHQRLEQEAAQGAHPLLTPEQIKELGQDE